MLRSIFLFSILVLPLFQVASIAAEPTSTSVESAGYQRVAAAGVLLTSFGTGFPANTMITVTATSFPLPTVLNGISILVGGVPAPLLFVSVSGPVGNFQINYQLPWEATGTTVEVFYNGTRISSESFSLSAAAPGLFTVAANGAGQAAAQNFVGGLGYTPNNSSSPVLQGGVLILYGGGTGLPVDQSKGALGNPITGAATPSTPLYTTLSQPLVTIGGRQAEVLFSGLAPGFTSLWQINVRVDPNTPAGNAIPVVINYGTKSTQAGVTVAVREAVTLPTK